MRILTYTFLIIILTTSSYAKPIITEAMVFPAKEQNGNYNEWVEIYNPTNKTINISGYKINNKTFDHDTLEAYKYLIIAEKAIGKNSFESYYGNNDGIWNSTDGNYTLNDAETFSFNDNEGIIIIEKDNYQNKITYNNTIQGYSIEKSNYSKNISIKSLSLYGTPGIKNSVEIKEALYFKGIIINEFLADPIGDDNSDMPNGEWIELYNPYETKNLEGLYFEKSSGTQIYITKANTLNTTIKDYLVIYTNGRLFLKNQGFETIKLYYQNTLLDSISYDYSKEGLSWSINNNIWTQTLPTPASKNKYKEPEEESNIEIEKIYDLKNNEYSCFGDIIRTKLKIYKGDTTKKTIKIYLTKEGKQIGKQAKLNLEKKYNNYEATIPMYIPQDKNYEEGNYYIIAEGLNEKETKRIEIIWNRQENENNKKGILYEPELPLFGIAGKDIESSIKITNYDQDKHHFKIWSYIYNGNKCYSGERESNIIEIDLDPNKEENIKLINKVNHTGDLNIKLLIKKDNLKTNKEFKEKITIFEKKEDSIQFIKTITQCKEQECTCPIIKPINKPIFKNQVIFQSSQEESKRLIPLILIISLIALILIIEIRR